MSKVYNIRNYEKNRNKIIESFRIVAFLYLITMLCVFPYYLKNSYSSCRSDKYHFFVIVTLIAMCAIGVFFAINYQKRPGGAVDIPLVDYANRSQLNLADISLLTFWGVNLLSSIFATISGGDFYVFFNGDNGRNMGLLTITMIVVAYFIISRFFVYKSRLFCVILICMSFMSILAILNYYYIDPLSLFERYQRQQHVIKNFTSTIGNKNFFSSLICIALPLAMGVAIATKDKITYCIANICVGIQFAALIVATSDGGFLGCFAGIAILFFISAKDLKRLSRFFVCLATLLVFSKLLWIFDICMDGGNKGYSSFSEIFVYNNWLFVLIPICLGLAILLSKINDDSGKITKVVFISVAITLVLMFLLIGVLVVYYTSNPEIETNEITSFFRFDEEWGTHRGFFWIRSFEMFKDFSLREKLFGVGTDNFVEPFLIFDEELIDRYNETHADAAHNVYINNLITSGILGAVAYLVFIFAVLKDAVKNAFKNPMSFALLSALVAYIAQDFVNLSTPVNTPWLFIIIGLSQACFLRSNSLVKLD